MSHLPRSLNHDSVFLNVPSQQCDQMLEVQSSQNTSKSCPNCSLLCFTSIDLLQNSPSHRSCWATFVSKFDANNFQKSPNLVTLETSADSLAANFITICNYCVTYCVLLWQFVKIWQGDNSQTISNLDWLYPLNSEGKKFYSWVPGLRLAIATATI